MPRFIIKFEEDREDFVFRADISHPDLGEKVYFMEKTFRVRDIRNILRLLSQNTIFFEKEIVIEEIPTP